METGFRSNELTTTSTMGLDLFDASRYVKASKANNTQRAYRAAWAEFAAFCDERGLCALPASPQAVIAYVTALAENGIRPATMQVKLAGISFAHRTAHQNDPTKNEDVKVIMSGIRRELGTAPSKKAPLLFEDVCKMVDGLPDDLGGVRDRALLLVGFAGAFRRSELVGLDLADVHFNGANMTITLRRSKTDQEGQGTTKFIPYLTGKYDPAQALKVWLKAANITSGPIFRQVDRWGHVGSERLTHKVVALVVKSAAEAAGLEPSQFSGHSLRAGFITASALAGTPEWEIQEQSGHKSERVLRGYIRACGIGAQDAVRRAFGQLTEGRE